LKLRAGLARFVIHTFNRHSKEEEQEESGELTVNTNHHRCKGVGNFVKFGNIR
jgi:hypothetical protein